MIGLNPEHQAAILAGIAGILKQLAELSDADLIVSAANPGPRAELVKLRNRLASEAQPFYETFRQLEDHQLRIDLALADGVRA